MATPTTQQPSILDAPDLQIVVNDPSHTVPTLVLVNGGLCILASEDQEAECVWCRELAGDCDFTGGGQPCDGRAEAAAAIREAAAAPTITIAFRAGGVR